MKQILLELKEAAEEAVESTNQQLKAENTK
jgi:hypothetical protein